MQKWNLILILIVISGLTVPGVVHANPVTDFVFHRHPEATTPISSDLEKASSPPRPEAMVQECDPIRQKVVSLNQKPFFVHPFYRPLIGTLKSKHYRCIAKMEEQQYQYLRNTNVDPKTAQQLLPPLDPSKPTPLPKVKLNK